MCINCSTHYNMSDWTLMEGIGFLYVGTIVSALIHPTVSQVHWWAPCTGWMEVSRETVNSDELHYWCGPIEYLRILTARFFDFSNFHLSLEHLISFYCLIAVKCVVVSGMTSLARLHFVGKLTESLNLFFNLLVRRSVRTEPPFSPSLKRTGGPERRWAIKGTFRRRWGITSHAGGLWQLYNILLLQLRSIVTSLLIHSSARCKPGLEKFKY